MAKIDHVMRVEIDLAQPVPELCTVIAHVLQAWSGMEKDLLKQLKAEIEGQLKQIEKEEKEDGKPVRESGRL